MVYTFLVAKSPTHTMVYAHHGTAPSRLYPYLWWKNYLIILQMIQFVFITYHQRQVFLSCTLCSCPKIFPAAINFCCPVILILFTKFYV